MGHYAARVLGQALPRLGAAAWRHVKEMQRKSEVLLRVDERRQWIAMRGPEAIWQAWAQPGKAMASLCLALALTA